MNLGDRQNSGAVPQKQNPSSQDTILRQQSEAIQRLQGYLGWVLPELQMLKKDGRPEDIKQIHSLISENALLKEERDSIREQLLHLIDDNKSLKNKLSLTLTKNYTIESDNNNLQRIIRSLIIIGIFLILIIITISIILPKI